MSQQQQLIEELDESTAETDFVMQAENHDNNDDQEIEIDSSDYKIDDNHIKDIKDGEIEFSFGRKQQISRRRQHKPMNVNSPPKSRSLSNSPSSSFSSTSPSFAHDSLMHKSKNKSRRFQQKSQQQQQLQQQSSKLRFEPSENSPTASSIPIFKDDLKSAALRSTSRNVKWTAMSLYVLFLLVITCWVVWNSQTKTFNTNNNGNDFFSFLPNNPFEDVRLWDSTYSNCVGFDAKLIIKASDSDPSLTKHKDIFAVKRYNKVECQRNNAGESLVTISVLAGDLQTSVLWDNANASVTATTTTGTSTTAFIPLNASVSVLSIQSSWPEIQISIRREDGQFFYLTHLGKGELAWQPHVNSMDRESTSSPTTTTTTPTLTNLGTELTSSSLEHQTNPLAQQTWLVHQQQLILSDSVQKAWLTQSATSLSSENEFISTQSFLCLTAQSNGLFSSNPKPWAAKKCLRYMSKSQLFLLRK